MPKAASPFRGGQLRLRVFEMLQPLGHQMVEVPLVQDREKCSERQQAATPGNWQSTTQSTATVLIVANPLTRQSLRRLVFGLRNRRLQVRALLGVLEDRDLGRVDYNHLELYGLY